MKKLIPQIRFQGFNDEWEEEKLGNISKSYSGGTPLVSEKRFYGGSIPFIRSAEINRNCTELFITQEGYENSSAKYVQVGDILYALYGATSGEVGRSKINGAINQAILAIQPNDEFDKEYIAQWLRKSKFYIINTFLQGGQGNLSAEIIKNLLLISPEKNEQTKIGSFFEEIDTLLSQKQAMVTKLQNFKKSMLEKMFPKEGTKIPEIRFKSFNGEWKSKALPDLVTFYNGLTYSPDYIEKKGTLVLRSSNIKNNMLDLEDTLYVHNSVVNVSNVECNDIIMVVRNGSKELLGKNIVIKEPMDNTVIGAFMVGIKSKVPNFYNALFNSNKFKVELEKNMGATINQITAYMFSKMYFMVTSNQEQAKIGSFFEKLDSLIQIQQKEIDKLQHIKKALLETMFV